MKTNLLGRMAAIENQTNKRIPQFLYEIVGVFVEGGVPCVLLKGSDGSLHTQLAVNVQVKVV